MLRRTLALALTSALFVACPEDTPVPTDTPIDSTADADTTGGETQQEVQQETQQETQQEVQQETQQEVQQEVDATPTVPTCADYCTAVMTNCTAEDAQFDTEANCLAFCAAAQVPAGVLTDNAVNTLGCRIYHAEFATSSGDFATHCPHAGASGGNTCGTLCDNYCQLAASNCTGGNELYADDTACQTACTGFATDGTDGDADGDTLQCRMYHLVVAGSSPPDSNSTHCPHGAVDGGGVCVEVTDDPTCEAYCTAVTANCTGANAQYADNQACLDYCNTGAQLPLGTAADTSGNTVGCRTYHAGVASTDAALHCPHAGPAGGNVCGTWCDNYCQLADTNCSGDDALTFAADCATDCAAFSPDGAQGNAAGDSVQCRIYHLGVASGDAPLHCPHGAVDGGGVCVGDIPVPPSCATYCATLTLNCTGDNAQYASEQACVDYCTAGAQLPLGTNDDIDGNTVGCRTYHADVAGSAPGTSEAIHCPHAGPNGGGVCGTTCENYCHLSDTNCTGDNALAFDADCATSCEAFNADGAQGDAAGDTAQCRIYHLGVAGSDPGTSEATHCPHGGVDGGGICVAPAPTCASYCETVTTNCTGGNSQYLDSADCLSYCETYAQLPLGDASDTGGNTVGCRAYHAGVAGGGQADADLHCDHAGPSGGAVCGTLCENYCHLSDTNCTGDQAITFATDCATDCAAYDASGGAGDTSGDSVQCRIYHLGVAGNAGAGGAVAHCGHGSPDGDSICVGPTPPSCAEYCTEVMLNCVDGNAQYATEQDCLDYCGTQAQMPAGDVTDTAGNTIGCRLYHADVAGTDDAALHCPHAGPSGGDVCGSYCDVYCQLSATNCTDTNALFADDTECQTACGAYAQTGDPGATTGDDVQCRIYHLGVAGDAASGGPGTHCAHGAEDGGGICVDSAPTPTCASYCTAVMANCAGDDAQYASEQACLDHCGTSAGWDAGAATDTDGNTIGCREYHAGVAATDAALHCPHAGPSGGNVCGTWCDNYCQLSAKNCLAGDELFVDDAACQTACGLYDTSADPGVAGGDSVQCRIYHLGVAGSDPGTSETAHCPHGGVDGGGICVNPMGADTCDVATVLNVSTLASGDTTGATDNYTPSDNCPNWPFDAGTDGPEHVFSFTPDTTGAHTITIGGGSDIFYVTTDCADIGNSCVWYHDNFWSGTSSDEVTMTAGTEYFIIVTDYDGAGADYTLNIDPPCVPSCGANICGGDGCGGSCGDCGTDEYCNAGTSCEPEAELDGNVCANPFVVDAFPYANSDDTSDGESADFDASGCGGDAFGAASPDSVYQITTDDTWVYDIVVQGFDAQLVTATACDATTSGCIARVDNGATFEGQRLPLMGASTIFAFVDGFSSVDAGSGAYDLTVEKPAPSCQLYCAAFLFTCDAATYVTGGEFTNQETCETWCETGLTDLGAIGDTDNDTAACRIYHAIVATSDPGTSEADHCPHAAPNGGGVCGALPVPAKLVVNEVDYDQAGTDYDEWVELKNVGGEAVVLAGYTVELVNGSSGSTYESIDLSTVVDGLDAPVTELAPGEFLLITASGAAVLSALADTVGRASLSAIQNGAPDGVQIVDGGGSIVDAVSYEGDVPNQNDWLAPEGSGAPGDASPFYETIEFSVARCGEDTDDNAVDFKRVVATPGADNTCTVPTYEADAQAILAAKCAPCHTSGSSGGHSIGTDFADALTPAATNSYAGAGQPCEGLNRAECALVLIQNGAMPLNGSNCSGDPALDAAKPGCLTQAEQDAIAAWIDGGVLEN